MIPPYFTVPLGSSPAQVQNALGQPDWILPRRGEAHWFYEEGHIVLTFTGTDEERPRLRSIARRTDCTKLRDGT